MIKNVIFDIGNVLLDFCWKDHIARFGFQGEKADRIAQAMMLGPIWPKLDLGLESDEDILEQFVAHTPELEQEIRLVFSNLSTIVREYEGSVDWIESLKARGYHTYYLSNYGERIRREASKGTVFPVAYGRRHHVLYGSSGKTGSGHLSDAAGPVWTEGRGVCIPG